MGEREGYDKKYLTQQSELVFVGFENAIYPFFHFIPF